MSWGSVATGYITKKKQQQKNNNKKQPNLGNNSVVKRACQMPNYFLLLDHAKRFLINSWEFRSANFCVIIKVKICEKTFRFYTIISAEVPSCCCCCWGALDGENLTLWTDKICRWKTKRLHHFTEYLNDTSARECESECPGPSCWGGLEPLLESFVWGECNHANGEFWWHFPLHKYLITV